MLQGILFFFSLAISAASFVLFAALAWQTIKETATETTVPPSTGAGNAQPQSLDITKVITETGKLSGTFAKSGPIATSASLSIFFAVLALVTSGVVEISMK